MTGAGKFWKAVVPFLLLLVFVLYLIQSTRHIMYSKYIFRVENSGKEFTVINGVDMVGRKIFFSGNHIYIDDNEIKYDLLDSNMDSLHIKYTHPDGNTFLYQNAGGIKDAKFVLHSFIRSVGFGGNQTFEDNSERQYKNLYMKSTIVFIKYHLFMKNLILYGSILLGVFLLGVLLLNKPDLIFKRFQAKYSLGVDIKKSIEIAGVFLVLISFFGAFFLL